MDNIGIVFGCFIPLHKGHESLLGYSEVTATSYLKRMEDELKIIVPVEGMGKGKYKFSM